MMIIIEAIIIIYLATLSIMLYRIVIEYRKKRVLKSYPFISFIIPVHNNEANVGKTIKSVHESYDNFEMFVIDDCSSDNTYKTLKKLRKQYKFHLLCNKKNIGKSESVNLAARMARGKILFIVDSDMIMNKPLTEDVIARINGKTVLACGSCKIKESDLLSEMQNMEFNVFNFTQWGNNGLKKHTPFGGCMAVRRDAFVKVGGFSKSFITEDINLTLKLQNAGWKTETSFYYVVTAPASTHKMWAKQQLRWVVGQTENIIEYSRMTWDKPVTELFMVSFSLVSVWALISLVMGIFHQSLNGVLEALAYSVISLPFIVPELTELKKVYKVFYIIPFFMFYWPILSVISLLGIIKGVVGYRKTKEGQRAW